MTSSLPNIERLHELLEFSDEIKLKIAYLA